MTVAQMTLDDVRPRLKPQAAAILRVLQAHPGVHFSALAFKRGIVLAVDGNHLVARIDAVSQRVGELRRAGYDVRSTGRGGHAPAEYWLEAS